MHKKMNNETRLRRRPAPGGKTQARIDAKCKAPGERTATDIYPPAARARSR